MADIQFNEEPTYSRPAFEEKRPFFVNAIIKTGIVDNARSANYVLMGFAVLLFCLSIVMFYIFNRSPEPEPISEIDIQLMNR